VGTTFQGNRFVKPADERMISYPAKGGVVISVGDLMAIEGNFAVPLSSLAGSGTAATDHLTVRDTFLGVATSARIAAQLTDGTVSIVSDCIYEADCGSVSTLKVGDGVSAFSTGAAAVGAISDIRVVETTDAAKQIGTVIKYYSGAITKVEVRLIGRSGREHL